MPNYCYNYIIISSDEGESFEKFKKTLNTADATGNVVEFSFHQTVPRPESEGENWYNWNIGNWGTKWDACWPTVEIADDEVIITCETAWEPPIQWARFAAENFNLCIRIEYEEPNNAFQGVCEADPYGVYNDSWEREPSIEDEDEIEDPNEIVVTEKVMAA